MAELLTFLRNEKKNHPSGDDVMICVKIAEDTSEAIPELELFLHMKDSPLSEGSYEIKDNETLQEVVNKNLKKQMDLIQKSYFNKMDKQFEF